MKRLSILTLAVFISITAFSQEWERSSSSQYLPTFSKADVLIPFAITNEGKRYNPTWGLDQAWINEQNLLKGINHMGKENVGIGRTSFRVLNPLVNDVSLTADQISGLRERSTLFDKIRKDLPLVMNCDNGYRPDGHTGSNINEYYTIKHIADIDHWATAINAHVQWMKTNTKHPIVGISPFNEPDYDADKNLIQGTAQNEADIARKLRESYTSEMSDIVMVGGNTLNDDKALEWYTPGQDVYDWGNTHQLAGSMDNYIAFHDRLQQDGKVGYNDEMHNVVEAMTGLEHGMNVGIWWGFDSRARGEFCQISRNGVRLAYGEHRNNWTAASVYRHDDGRVKAFVGSSERQASTTTYQFVSTERDVYYDGYGPVREYFTTMPGGTGYQKGQTNAERVIDVTWGEDVAPGAINGIYKIVNKKTGRVLSSTSIGQNITQQQFSASNKRHQWIVRPCSNELTGGDLSFYDISSVESDTVRMDVKNFSTVAKATIIAWGNKKPSSNEQWYLEYAGNGCYYIRNRESALYLSLAGNATTASVVQDNLQNSDSNRERQKWRIIPVDVTYDTSAPAKPVELRGRVNPASVTLMWTENTEEDLEGYMVLRAQKGTNDWNTIARKVKTNYFTDNSCRQGVDYEYKIKAIDLSQNISLASDVFEATPTGERSMIARWHMDENMNDDTPNWFDIACSAKPAYVSGHKDDSKALSLTSSSFVQLPYEIASTDELSIAMWVNWRSSGTWQRIFDFGIDTEHYMFLTPKNGSTSKMRFAIKNGGDELFMDCPTALTARQWKHIVVSLGKDKTTIYVDGSEVASSTGINIRPSDIHPILNYLGRSQFNTDPNFVGYLDDVRVYNYAVNADEVQTIMSDQPTGIEESLEKDTEIPSSVFGLDGVRRKSPRPGFNIINKKKVIVR